MKEDKLDNLYKTIKKKYKISTRKQEREFINKLAKEVSKNDYYPVAVHVSLTGLFYGLSTIGSPHFELEQKMSTKRKRNMLFLSKLITFLIIDKITKKTSEKVENERKE
jgi:hexokinase